MDVQILFRVLSARVVVNARESTPKLRYGAKVQHLGSTVEGPKFDLPEIVRNENGTDEFVTRWVRAPIPVLATVDSRGELTRAQLFNVLLQSQDEKGVVTPLGCKTISVTKYHGGTRVGRLKFSDNIIVDIELSMEVMRTADGRLSPKSLASVVDVADHSSLGGTHDLDGEDIIAMQSGIEKIRKENMDLQREIQYTRRQLAQCQDMFQETTSRYNDVLEAHAYRTGVTVPPGTSTSNVAVHRDNTHLKNNTCQCVTM